MGSDALLPESMADYEVLVRRSERGFPPRHANIRYMHPLAPFCHRLWADPVAANKHLLRLP